MAVQKNKTLGEFIIENQSEFKYSSGELSRLINSIRLAAKVVNHEVNKAGLVDIIGQAGEVNVQGEDQQKLDVFANETFINTLTNREIVCGIASEEEEDFITIQGRNGQNDNKYVVLIDPLDGSSNIDVNVSVGTIFSIYRRVTPAGTPVSLEDFLQAGNRQSGGGLYHLWHFHYDCVFYGPWSKRIHLESSFGDLLLVPSKPQLSRERSNLLR